MTAVQDASILLYNLALIPVTFFSIAFIILSFINLALTKTSPKKYKELKKLPFISVQIPTFNDPIALRCVKKCLEFDYPKNKYEIIIVDDSTNKDTKRKLKLFASKHRIIKYVWRSNREGYKPGALNNAMKYTKGEILTVLDSDWIPAKDYLRTIVKPFSDPKVAVVQSTQGFYNHKKNLITRFAAYTIMIYYAIIMPINNKVNSVFFCGTAGAIRRKPFEKVGGWNMNSITEDADLTVRLLLQGYKTVYVKYETPSEVPDNLESFLKQQMRWCYGNIRVFLDNAKGILFSKKLNFKQRLTISYVTIFGNSMAVFVLMMTLFGFSGWFLGEPALITFNDVITLFIRIFLTIGFFFIGFIAFLKLRILKEYKYLVYGVLSIGIILAMANTIAFVLAVLNKNLSWYCTPKTDNAKVVAE